MKNRTNGQSGFLAMQVLIYASIGVLIVSAAIAWAGKSYRDSLYVAERELAFYIAESGIEYYRWHLAHANSDFQDGTGAPGPYVHDYEDTDGNVIGTFTLNITPPIVGSTIVTIASTGRVVSNPAIQRTIEARLAIPSLAKYAFALNSAVRFGAGTEVFGEVQSNGGIRFDGIAHNVVASALATYDDPDHAGGNEFGVHTHDAPGDPLPPAAVPNRPDIFEAGRLFPVPAIDFNGFTASLADMKTDAQANGRYHAASGGLGYLVRLRTDDTYDLYRVNSLNNPSASCRNNSNAGDPTWGSYSVTGTTNLGNFSFPANGILFLEDHVWIDGTIDGARVTIASARFPENPATNTNITVNNDIRYTNIDGTDVLAFIAQGDFVIGMISDNDLRIDGSILAKNGRARRHYYASQCNPYHTRANLTLYGMLSSNGRYGFAFTDNTGYLSRDIIYDANLLYGPPPSFPLSSNEYMTISWREI